MMSSQWNRIVIASTNKGKVREFAYRLSELTDEISSLSDFPEMPEVVEDGITFLENAEKKARAIGTRLGLLSIADDSGLCVSALNGAPGVYSARYAGEHATDRDNVHKLLAELKTKKWSSHEQSDVVIPHQPQSGVNFLSPAYFACALVVFDPTSDLIIRAEGQCPGWIIDQPFGEGGFGYDPVFYLPEFGKTMAELSMDQKNAISHRGNALTALLKEPILNLI